MMPAYTGSSSGTVAEPGIASGISMSGDLSVAKLAVGRIPEGAAVLARSFLDDPSQGSLDLDDMATFVMEAIRPRGATSPAPAGRRARAWSARPGEARGDGPAGG